MHISSEDLRYYADCRDRRMSARSLKRQALAETFAQAITDEELTVALPSGKSLQAPVLDALARADIAVTNDHARQCLAGIKGLPFLNRVAFGTPSVIPLMVSCGMTAFGFTGYDMVREFDDYDADTDDRNSTLHICEEFPISKSTMTPTRGVMFVRDDDPIENMEDLVAALGRERSLNVVTEYPASTTSFLREYGLSANLCTVRGSAETFVSSGQHRFGVALTETGITLKQNGLRIIGELFQSKTVLVANRAFLDLAAGNTMINHLVERMHAACAG